MEKTLFWIGVGLGVYALILRLIFRKDNKLSETTLVGVLHVFFTTAVGGLVGFIVSASMELQGPTLKMPLLGLFGGLVWGGVELYFSRRKKVAMSEVLRADQEWIETTFSAVILASVIMYCVVQAFKIPSGSMMDTLLIKDHLFVNKFIYGIRIPYTEKRVLKLRDVKRGDVIVFECPQSALNSDERERGIHKDFIKRAVALPGDIVEVKNKVLFINGVAQVEPYVVHRQPYYIPRTSLLDRPDYQTLWESGQLSWDGSIQGLRDNFGPLKVPPGHYMAMGDNRDESFDSRFWGPLPERLLKGRAWVVYWPIKRIKVIR